MKRMMILFSLGSAFIIMSTTCVFAGGPPIQTLKGDWATIATRSCVQANAGGHFGSGPQYKLLADGSTRIVQTMGTLSFFGDGTGSWIGKHFTINNASVEANTYPVIVSEVDCDVTYQVMPDGAIGITFKNCGGLITAGYLTGSSTGSSTDVVERSRLSGDGITMVFSDLEPYVETTWVTTSGVTTYYDRICSRAGTAIRIR